MAEASVTWVDGEIAGAVPTSDRGMLYGDGLFETLLLRRGKPLYLSYHMQRLQAGLGVLRMPDCSADVLSQLERLVTPFVADQHAWSSLRVTVTRGGGQRGYAPPQSPQPRIILHLHPLTFDPTTPQAPATLEVASHRVSNQPVFAGVKHLNRLDQVLIAEESQRRQCDQMLVLNAQDDVVGVTSGNLFALCDDGLVTPPLKDCVIAGTRRRCVISDWAPQLGLRVRERPLRVDDVRRAKEVFFSNSLQTLRSVGQCGSVSYHEYGVCRDLFARFISESV